MNYLESDVSQDIGNAYAPYSEHFELWCHRTRVIDPDTFWNGLEIPRLQQGIESTAIRVGDENDLNELTTRFMPEDPLNNARLFLVLPEMKTGLLSPLETEAKFRRKGLLPGRFVLAHLSFLPSTVLTYNRSFDAQQQT